MTRRGLPQSHTYRDLHQHFSHHAALQGTRNGGPHTIYRGPSGSVPVPNHNGDVPHGTLRSIVKMALLAGLGVVLMALMLTLT
jgi:hypothetical protein